MTPAIRSIIVRGLKIANTKTNTLNLFDNPYHNTGYELFQIPSAIGAKISSLANHNNPAERFLVIADHIGIISIILHFIR